MFRLSSRVNCGVFAVYCLTGLSIVRAESIPPGYRVIAHEYLIPPPILYAIALTESGLRLQRNLHRPWPWTLNVAGKPKRYATRIDAYQALIRYLKQGIRSIDIGLMQVNWRYHRQKLGTPWQALDPYHNIRTGAQILRDAYRENQQWNQAIGRYHSPGKTPAQQHRAKRYRDRVLRHAKQLIKLPEKNEINEINKMNAAL